MFILMAVGAVGKDSVTHRSPRQVATLTGDPAVATPQRITGPIVIEIHLSNLLPSGGSVATLAVAPQSGLMRIPVTVGAAGERHLGQPEKAQVAFERLLHRLVAGLALDLPVKAGERETGFFVSEGDHRQPRSLTVAGLTGPGLELSPVLVTMTRQAIRAEPQKRPLEVLTTRRQNPGPSVEL
jgi:hypothetical protein